MQLLKFYADWCGPCKVLSSKMEDVTFPYEVKQINIDEDSSMDLAMKYGVRGVPFLVLVDDEGKVITSKSGSMTKDQLIETFITGVN